MNIRELKSSDYHKFLPLICEFRNTEFSEDEYNKQLKQINQFGEIWVIESDKGLLVATGTILYEPKFIYNLSMLAHIEDVCVSNDYRGHGIGKMLVNHMILKAKEKKCYKVTLDCADHNVPFYEACGLQRRGNQMCL